MDGSRGSAGTAARWRRASPIVERIGVRLNVIETVLEVPQQSVITRDNAVAAKAAYEVSNLQLAILNQ